jgi:hypothetical protein
MAELPKKDRVKFPGVVVDELEDLTKALANLKGDAIDPRLFPTRQQRRKAERDQAKARARGDR